MKCIICAHVYTKGVCHGQQQTRIYFANIVFVCYGSLNMIIVEYKSLRGNSYAILCHVLLLASRWFVRVRMGLVYSFRFLLVFIQSEDVSYEYGLFLTDEEVTTSVFRRPCYVQCLSFVFQLECTNTGRHFANSTKFRTVTPIMYMFLVWTLLHITFVAPTFGMESEIFGKCVDPWLM